LVSLETQITGDTNVSWSLGENRVSAAEQKRILRGEGDDPAAVFSN
jgi:hypothetical protein